MEYDQAEFDAIEADQKYKDQTARSRAFAAPHTDKIVDNDLVEFYGSKAQTDPYGKWLSNCVYANVTIDNVVYRSSEHYYQCQKFNIRKDDPSVVAWCKTRSIPLDHQLAVNELFRSQLLTLTPVGVAKEGQTNRAIPMRGDWEQVKRRVMYDAVLAKFLQNKDFADALKNTGNAVLVERAPTDSIWAINSKGRGSNWLGVILMMVRSVLE